MVQGVDLLADKVVETVGRVGENQAISDPFGGFNADWDHHLSIISFKQRNEYSRLRHLSNQIKRSLDTFIANFNTRIQGRIVRFAVESEEVEGVGGGDCDEVARAGPGDLHVMTPI